DSVRSTMDTTRSKSKEVRIPGPDHPITISPVEGKVRVTLARRIVAESTRVLRLKENGYPPVYYLPRNDANMSLLLRTTHYTYCPTRAIAPTTAFPSDPSRKTPFGHTKKPYEAVASIGEYLAFYPSRVDAIEVIA